MKSNTTLDLSTRSLMGESAESVKASRSERPTEVSVPRKRRKWIVLTLCTLLVISSVLLFPFLLLSGPTQMGFMLPAIGTMRFTSSEQFDPTNSTGLDDGAMVSLQSVPSPAPGMSYYLWLLPDQQNDESVPPLLVGTISSLKNTPVHYTAPDHQNLLARYSGVLITQQKADPTPLIPSLDHKEWRYQGHIPNQPSPNDPRHYSLLDHVRHLEAVDPTLTANGLSGGLSIWLYRNTGKILEWSTAARDGWTGKETQQSDLIHRHMIRILDTLDGVTYADRSVPTGSPFLADPRTSHFGLLDVVQGQDPPGLLPHVALHLQGLISAPGREPSQEQLAKALLSALDFAAHRLQNVRADVQKLVFMDPLQLRGPEALSLMNDLVTNATAAYVGESDPIGEAGQSPPVLGTVATGHVMASPLIFRSSVDSRSQLNLDAITLTGGVNWIYQQVPQLAVVQIIQE